MAEEFSNIGKDDFIKLVQAELKDIGPVMSPEGEESAFAAALKTLADHPFNKAAPVGPSAKFGKYHVPLRKSLISIATIAAAMTTSGIALVGLPIVGFAGMAATLLGVLQQVGDLVTKLSQEEVVIYEILLSIAKHRVGTSNAKLGSTTQEVEAAFKARKQAPPPLLSENLENMVVRKLLRADLSGKEKRYSVVS